MKIFSSEKEHNDDLFMTIQLVVLNNKINENGVVCTKEFIEGIVANQERYIHLPLFCDLDALRAHGTLSHNFDRRNNEFNTAQIGSFVSFSSVELDGVTYLLGTAKVSKRNSYIVEALEDLAEHEELKFSYEINTRNTYDLDGIEYIPNDEGNNLIGVTVVSNPAVLEARALLVAEKSTEKGDDLVEDNKEKDPALEEEEKEEKPETAASDKEDKPEEKPVDEDNKKDNKEVDKEEKPETASEDPVDEDEEKPDDKPEEKPVDEDKETASDDEDGKKEELVKLQKQNAELAENLKKTKDDLEKAQKELKDIRDKEAKKEQAEKREELVNKYASVLNEEEMIELSEAFDSLNENAINAKLAEKLLRQQKQKEKETQTASVFRITDTVQQKKNKWINL